MYTCSNVGCVSEVSVFLQKPPNDDCVNQNAKVTSDSGHSQELCSLISWSPKHVIGLSSVTCALTVCQRYGSVFDCEQKRFKLWTHLAAQSGELAEGDDQIVKHVIEAIVSCNHRTFPAKHRRPHTLTADKHKVFTLHSLLQLNAWQNYACFKTCIFSPTVVTRFVRPQSITVTCVWVDRASPAG